MLQLQNKPHDGGAKDGKIQMSWGLSRTMVGVERLAVVGPARPQSLAVASVADRDAVRRGPPYGHHLAASSRRHGRLPRLLPIILVLQR